MRNNLLVLPVLISICLFPAGCGLNHPFTPFEYSSPYSYTNLALIQNFEYDGPALPAFNSIWYAYSDTGGTNYDHSSSWVYMQRIVDNKDGIAGNGNHVLKLDYYLGRGASFPLCAVVIPIPTAKKNLRKYKGLMMDIKPSKRQMMLMIDSPATSSSGIFDPYNYQLGRDYTNSLPVWHSEKKILFSAFSRFGADTNYVDIQTVLSEVSTFQIWIYQGTNESGSFELDNLSFLTN
jgi:hypothetical protein